MNRKQRRVQEKRRGAAAPASLSAQQARASFEQGTNLLSQGLLEQAEAAFRAALALRPSMAEAHCNLGILLRHQGRIAEAVSSFANAVRHQPDLVEAHNNLGNSLKELDRRDDALKAYRQALRQRRDYGPAQHNLGLALLEQGDTDAAMAHLRAALLCSPDHAEAHHDLGNGLRRQGAPDRALPAYRRAMILRPGHADAACNLGLALQELGLTEPAWQAFSQALRYHHDHVEALLGLGALLRGAGRLQEAISCLERALQLRPDLVEAWNSLGNVLADQGRLIEAEDAYREALQRQPDFAGAAANLLVNGCYRADLGLAEMQQRAGHCSALVAASPAPITQPNPADRPRIGFVSADFRFHPVGNLAIGAVEALGALGYDLTCYSNSALQDAMTARYALAARWRTCLGWSDDDLAAQIRRDQIDILVDLSGHSDGNRLGLFARRAAALQVSWLGFPATTGLAAMDALLADPYQVPVSAEPYYSETIARLPHCWAPFEAPVAEPPPGPLPAMQNGFVTFGSFNALKKISSDMVALWAQLLHRCAGSRLIIKAVAVNCPATRDRFRQMFESHGITPQRLDLVGPTPLAEHRAWMRRADIALDPFPFSGGMTSLEALWSGVPVIARVGETFSSRDSVGFLTAVGCSDLAAEDDAGYLARASALAADLDALDHLRQSLRSRMLTSPLCDKEQFGRDLGQLLTDLWRRKA